MKKQWGAAVLTVAMCFLIAGCASQNENSSSYSASSSQNSARGDMLSVEGYQMVRDVFAQQYRSAADSIQKQLATFDMSDSWWDAFHQQVQTATTIADTFFKNESKISDECRQDFEKIKEAVNQFAQAFNKIGEAFGQSSDEQTVTLSEGAALLNQANANWKSNAGSFQLSSSSLS